MMPLYMITMSPAGNLVAQRIARLDAYRSEDFAAMRRPAHYLRRGSHVVREAASSLDALRQVEAELARTEKKGKVKA